MNKLLSQHKTKIVKFFVNPLVKKFNVTSKKILFPCQTYYGNGNSYQRYVVCVGVCVSDHQQMPKDVFPMELQHNTYGQEVHNSSDGKQRHPNLSIKPHLAKKQRLYIALKLKRLVLYCTNPDRLTQTLPATGPSGS